MVFFKTSFSKKNEMLVNLSKNLIIKSDTNGFEKMNSIKINLLKKHTNFIKERIIFLNSEITDKEANQIVQTLYYFDIENSGKEIKLFINGAGGTFYDCMPIYDAIQSIKSDVTTICFGQISSMSTLLLVAGTKGKRFAFPNSRIIINQPEEQEVNVEGPVEDININIKQLLSTKQTFYKLLSYHTNFSIPNEENNTSNMYTLSAWEALNLGFIDNIIEPVFFK
uniref:ATP-dependent Clp protease proteolytic subunit n=1 Tax=Cyanoptyche gloeocystis TaxID=77922 RepID=A0A3G1IW79_9EUKA|nr:ATP-dependent Clp protease proteolytic subunit [Cyanoptyche gloeocystis]